MQQRKSTSRLKALFLVAASTLLLLLVYGVWTKSVPNTLSPFCSYDLTYQLTATVRIGGENITDSIIYQHPVSRDWIKGIISGCEARYSFVLSFRTKSGSVLLLPAHICSDAKYALADPRHVPGSIFAQFPVDYSNAMRNRASVNLLKYCFGTEDNLQLRAQWQVDDRKNNRVPQAYAIDHGDSPTAWEPIILGSPSLILPQSVKLLEVVAVAMDEYPYDNLEKNAPALLRSSFTGVDDWWDSPERVIPWSIRHANGFKFELARRGKLK